MPPTASIADSTDWLNTSLPLFSQLDSALRCQVCKDFFDTPMITSCSHTFCSLCIRRCLSADGKCPTCRAGDQEVKLRRNWTAQETVDAFGQAREGAMKLARQSTTAHESQDEQAHERRRRGKRKIEDTDLDSDAMEISPRKTRSSNRRTAAPAVHQNHDVEVISSDGGDDDYQSDPKDGLVPCPICHKRMKEEVVFSHLDHCQGGNSNQHQSSGRSSRSRSATTTPHLALRPQTPSAKPLERLPQINYALLKDNALRKKLSDLGIPSTGPRQLLIRRHTEWVNLWNANADSTRPRTKRELLDELNVWERSQGGQALSGVFSVQSSGSSVMQKDFDAKGWVRDNKDQYQDLIAQARRKAKQAKQGKEGSEVNGTTPVSMPEEMSRHETHTADEYVATRASNFGEPHDPRKPYENNEEALSTVRAKVEAVNNGVDILQSPPPPRIERSNADTTEESKASDDPGEAGAGDEPSALPAKFPSPSDKMNMFRLPEKPVVDVESGMTTD